MSESSESRFVYTMRKASNLSALSVGAADHRDLILTANGRLVHAAKLLGFDGVRGETIDVTRTRAANYVIHHLVGITGETYETIESWTVDAALSRLGIAQAAGKLQAAASSLSIPEIGPVELPDDLADSIVRPGECQGEDEAEATKPTGATSKREQRAQWLAQAMLLVRDHPDWSDAEIARRVGKDKSTLSRSKEYQAAAAMARGVKDARHRGHISVDPDSGLRDVEAYSDDPAERDWDN